MGLIKDLPFPFYLPAISKSVISVSFTFILVFGLFLKVIQNKVELSFNDAIDKINKHKLITLPIVHKPKAWLI